MRFAELTLERYGAFAERSIAIPATAGLTVIYGPNEAGKSTCLAALSDFLFGIPERTPHGSLFGYDGMRVGATLIDASGAELILRRRRGRGRTLTDAAGTPLDDSTLTRLLGATTRERFATLFGLNHETLRSGGSRLLNADGDIGRLIVEAGGGLRSLMAKLDTIDAEADKLFATRRSADRAFYQALDAFDAADRHVKLQTVTRDAYEQSRKTADGARAKLDHARAQKQSVSAEISGLERLVRAVPHLLELDRLTAQLSEYVDLDSLPTDFGGQVEAAIAKRDAAVTAFAEGRIKRDRFVQRLDALTASEAFIEAETRVRDLSEQAIHVRKARDDRPNRLKDIQTAEAGLSTLRRMLHLDADTDLSARLPAQAALDQVQSLATQAIERGAAIAAARERSADLADRQHILKLRLDNAAAAGHDKPLSFSAAQFTSLAGQFASAHAARRQADQAIAGVAARVGALGFPDMEALAGFVSPGAEVIRAEQSEREELETALAGQVGQKVEADKAARMATEAIEALESAGPVATDEALTESRRARADTWAPLRCAYLDADIPPDAAVRRAEVQAYERHGADADDLADRRAAEAQHAANLVLARQQLAKSTIAADGCSTLIADLSERLERRTAAFAEAFPDATARFAQLDALLDFAERRTAAIDASNAADLLSGEADRHASELAPQIALFRSAQQAMQKPPAEGQAFAVEVQTLSTALVQHETGHADYLRDLRDSEALAPTGTRAQQDLANLLAAEGNWQQIWSAALGALSLDADIPPESAGRLVSEWAGARGTLGTIAQTQVRVARMDEDEAALKAAILALGSDLQLALPDDLLAAAALIESRWQEQDATRVQRATLLPDVDEAKADCLRLEKAEEEARAVLEALAASADVPVDGEALPTVAGRCASRAGLLGAKVLAERSIADVSDGLGTATLREQWAARDLDALRGALEVSREQSTQLESEVEEAILAQKTARDALDAFASESGVNQAVADRESAAARMQVTVERYVDLTVARALITKAIDRVRSEQQDPLVSRAGELFAYTTRGEFTGVGADIDEKGLPVVVGRRQSGAAVSVATMSDGTRDQLFLAFRLASLENYSASTEPLPFIADDILVHFDDDRGAATLELLARFGETNQVLLFTHHKSVRDEARRLAERGLAAIVEIDHHRS